MFEKYIQIKETKIICGQRSSDGTWYCKELPAETPKQLDYLIGDVNGVLNKYNKEKESRKKGGKASPPPSKVRI